VNRLADRVVLVTGAASGIGEAVCTLFAEEGAEVVGFDRQTGSTVVGEVTDLSALEGAVALAEERYGALHAVVASAGIIAAGTVETTSEEAWRRTLDVNLTGSFLTVKAAVPALRRASGGSIVTVSSAAGLAAWFDQTAYDASKGGLVNFTRSVALDYASEGIRANCLVPAFVKSPMSDRFIAETGGSKVETSGLIPLGRMSTPREMAYGALFLACDESSYMTGSTLVLDGGYLAR
jgi:NAD(P)-dependent dehydrogenase (short-subunit alcohol dehydrogenase family)